MNDDKLVALETVFIGVDERMSNLAQLVKDTYDKMADAHTKTVIPAIFESVCVRADAEHTACPVERASKDKIATEASTRAQAAAHDILRSTQQSLSDIIEYVDKLQKNITEVIGGDCHSDVAARAAIDNYVRAIKDKELARLDACPKYRVNLCWRSEGKPDLKKSIIIVRDTNEHDWKSTMPGIVYRRKRYAQEMCVEFTWGDDDGNYMCLIRNDGPVPTKIRQSIACRKDGEIIPQCTNFNFTAIK